MTRRPAARRIWLGASLFALAAASTVASPAVAWKPKTHIHLAEEVLKDAIDDGKVTIYETDYATGKILGVLGSFAVDPKALAALKAAPQQFRAGVLGPDAYPDIMTGQEAIHPDNSQAIDGGAQGSNAWLTQVWTQGYANSTSPQVNAFALGFLTHAAGDVFAHTFVNSFSGGEFMVRPDPRNAIKHLVLEGYIGRRTPITQNAFPKSVAGGTTCNQRKRDDIDKYGGGAPVDDTTCGITHSQIYTSVTQEDTSISGVEDFIYRNMTFGAPGTLLQQKLLTGDGCQFSVPCIYSLLRNGLQQKVYDYEKKLATLSGPAWIAYKATGGPVAAYEQAWIADIDAGLKAWPATSHEVAKALVYNYGGADVDRAKAVMGTYVREHLASMSGVPDGLVWTVGAIHDVMNAIIPAPLQEAIDKLKQAPVDFLIMSATGKTPNEWKEFVEKPENHFDAVMNSAGGGHDGDQPHLITLSTFNRDYLKIRDTAYSNPAEYWKIEDLPPAFDTVQLTKMLLLSEGGMRDLIAALKAKGVDAPAQPAPLRNVMLGWVRSLDHGNQWQGLQTSTAGASPQPFLAANGGAAWRHLFLKVEGEKAWADGSGSSSPTHGASPVPTPPGPDTPSPTPAPTPTLPGRGWGTAPAPASAALTLADLAGSWSSDTGVLEISAGPNGDHAEWTPKGAAAPAAVMEIGADLAGAWRRLGGSGEGAVAFQRGASGQIVMARTAGATLGAISVTLTRTGAAPAPSPAPSPGAPTGSSPPAGSPTTGSPPVRGGGGGVVGGGSASGGGGFAHLTKVIDLKIDGASVWRDGLEIHMVATLRNAAPYEFGPTTGNFRTLLTMQDGESVRGDGLYRPTGDPPTAFMPTVAPGAEVKLRFRYRYSEGMAQPKSVTIRADNSPQTLTLDVSNLHWGPPAK